MSSETGNRFAEENAAAYADFLTKWDKKLDGSEEVTKDLGNEWGDKLSSALQAQLVETLVIGLTASLVAAGLTAATATILGWATIATKKALKKDSQDLLRRTIETKSSENSCKNEFATCPPGFTIAEAIKRAKQTVAQIYDMAKDKINELVLRFFTKSGDLTGRRRWASSGSKNSRHASLNGQVRNQDANFNYKGDKISGPRPQNGKPENWSNCSCRIQVERKVGSKLQWVDL